MLETEPQVVASRVSMRGADGDVPAVEQVRAAFRSFDCCECCVIALVQPS